MEVLCREQLSGETVSMSLDGWSNVHNETIVCVAVTGSTGVTYVTDTIDTSGKPHTSDYLKELAMDTTSATESKYGCKVKSFVTDNAANMTAMKQNLAHDEQNKRHYYLWMWYTHAKSVSQGPRDTQCVKAHCQNCEIL